MNRLSLVVESRRRAAPLFYAGCSISRPLRRQGDFAVKHWQLAPGASAYHLPLASSEGRRDRIAVLVPTCRAPLQERSGRGSERGEHGS
eukprot:SAG31_NODE_275_length_18666_cov_8.489309_8_plen_89_part_00